VHLFQIVLFDVRLSPWVALAVGVIVLVSALLQAALGFGFALIAVPLLMLVINPQTAVICVFLVASVASVLTLRATQGAVNVAEAKRLSIGAVLAMPLGVALLISAPSVVLRLLLGFVTIAAALWMLFGHEAPSDDHVPNASLGYVAGAISGVLNTALSTNGPPLVVYLRHRGLSTEAFRSTISVVFTISNLVGLVLLAAGGAIHREALVLALLAAPFNVVGWLMGNAWSKHLAPHHFDRVVDVVLLASGVVVLVRALI
jgi:uncharacterized membrane protein YfcA